MPKKDKAGLRQASDGKDIEFVATKPAEYEGIIGMVKYNDEARKKS